MRFFNTISPNQQVEASLKTAAMVIAAGAIATAVAGSPVGLLAMIGAVCYFHQNASLAPKADDRGTRFISGVKNTLAKGGQFVGVLSEDEMHVIRAKSMVSKGTSFLDRVVDGGAKAFDDLGNALEDFSVAFDLGFSVVVMEEESPRLRR